MSARTTKRNATPRRERERRLLASLIDPATRDAAAAIVEKTGLRVEMFADDNLRDNYHALTMSGPDVFAGYIEQAPVADYSTADEAQLEADCREIVATWKAAHPKETTPEEILAQVGMAIEDAADFLKRTIPPPRWIISDFIAQHMKGDLCGGAKSMKTFAALQMAVCIAAGRDFLDIYHVDRPHTVAYLNLELFDWNAQERLNTQTTAAGLDIDAEILRGRLYILNMRANPAALRGQCDIGACSRCQHRDTCHGKEESICRAQTAERMMDAFSSVLKKHGVELVIIDPRYKLIMPGEDENTGDGLRGVLALRDALARHFAVNVVTHDPKGDTSGRKTTDRGAGSYTAGADFDFRLTIDRSKDYNEENGDLLYVVAAACRARKTPPKVGVRFDPAGQVFKVEDGISTELKTARPRGQLTQGEKAERNRKEADDFRAAVIALANEHGSGDPIATEVFKRELTNRTGLGEKKLDGLFAAMLSENAPVIVKQPELYRNPRTAAIVAKPKKLKGRVFVMTPEAAEAYRATFDGLAI